MRALRSWNFGIIVAGSSDRRYNINGGQKKWVQAIQLSLNTRRPQCSRLSYKDITDSFIMKIDEFSATNRNSNTRCKIAAQVTGLQQPAKTIQDVRKIRVLNEQFSLMKMESSAMVLHTYGSETFVRRERICFFQTWRLHYCRPQGKVIGFTYL